VSHGLVWFSLSMVSGKVQNIMVHGKRRVWNIVVSLLSDMIILDAILFYVGYFI